MSDLSISLYLREPVSAHSQLAKAWTDCIKPNLMAGRQMVCKLVEAEDERSLQQNAFMWAFVLKQIKLQAVIDGIGADEEGWHLYFKRRLLGYRVVKTKVPGKKRPSITRELRSTTDLSVKRMSKYLDEVMAVAATEFGVTFPAGKRWEDWSV